MIPTLAWTTLTSVTCNSCLAINKPCCEQWTSAINLCIGNSFYCPAHRRKE